MWGFWGGGLGVTPGSAFIVSSVCPDHPTTLTEKSLLNDELLEIQLLPQRPGCIWGNAHPGLAHHSSHPGPCTQGLRGRVGCVDAQA